VALVAESDKILRPVVLPIAIHVVYLEVGCTPTVLATIVISAQDALFVGMGEPLGAALALSDAVPVGLPVREELPIGQQPPAVRASTHGHRTMLVWQLWQL